MYKTWLSKEKILPLSTFVDKYIYTSRLFLTKNFADELRFSQVQLIFDRNVFAEDLSYYEYTQFIALYSFM